MGRTVSCEKVNKTVKGDVVKSKKIGRGKKQTEWLESDTNKKQNTIDKESTDKEQTLESHTNKNQDITKTGNEEQQRADSEKETKTSRRRT